MESGIGGYDIMISTAPAKAPEVRMPKNKKERKSENIFAGVIIGDQAWKTELMQAPTTHGPMDIRLWRRIK